MDELYHHGIFGQRWGVRRFQNADGSLTEAGRKRYNTDISGQKDRLSEAKADRKAAYKRLKREQYTFVNGGFGSSEARRAYSEADKRVAWEKKKLSDEKVKEKLNNSSDKKSKRRLALEQKYMEKGMSAEEAEIAAYKRVRAERAVAVAGGITLAAAAAYGVYKYRDLNADKMIKSGVGLQNISDTDKLDLGERFFASVTESDKTAYRGKYGTELMLYGKNNIFSTTATVGNDGLKVAGRKKAAEILSDLMKDDAYKTQVRSEILKNIALAPLPSQKVVLERAIRDIDSGKFNKRVYDAFNLTMFSDNRTADRFTDVLKKSGYDAIIDMNDKKYSGYDTEKPLIVFNGAAKAAVSAVDKLSSSQIAIDKATIDIADAIENTAKGMASFSIGIGAAAAAGKAAKTAVNSKQHDRIVNEYRKEHPGTKLTYNQILDSYYNSK